MKNLIITVAILVLLLIFTVFQSDINLMSREQMSLKDATEEIANTAALQFDKERYGEGIIVFDDVKANAAALQVLKDTVGVNNDFTPNNDYYTDSVQFYMYYFDDNLEGRKYYNGTGAGAFEFQYGDTVSSVCDITTITGEDFVVSRPCVVCIVNAGSPEMNVDSLEGQGRIMKMSVYEWDYPH